MTKKIFSVAIIAAAFLLSGCASYHLRQGNRLYKDLAYSMAIEEYQKGLSKKENAAARIKLAESYRKMNNLQKAEEEYAKVVLLPEAEPIHKLRYGQLLMRSGKYVVARSYFELYLQANPNDQAVAKLKSSCDSIEIWQKDSAKDRNLSVKKEILTMKTQPGK